MAAAHLARFPAAPVQADGAAFFLCSDPFQALYLCFARWTLSGLVIQQSQERPDGLADVPHGGWTEGLHEGRLLGEGLQ